ncbi:hypothetical protein E4U57_000107 [Claviceps arundinis]|uniref:Uncharacterized protein n=1 Tax=Claviceps arundinis TaxID=1623583 RepID=A0ABQ7PLS8_9HYPO|nr:hypothetical protein E4U57_000107 [Claviceps arundinis]
MEAQLSTETSTSTETEIRRVTPQQAREVLERRRRQRESMSAGVANGLRLISLRREVADGASAIALSGSSRAEWDQLDADFPEEDLYRRMWQSTREHALGDGTSLTSYLSDSSDSLRRLSVITIEDDAAPADLITIDDDTESDCDLQQKDVNLEDIEKMKVKEDDSDSEDEGSLGQQALT